MDKSVYKSSDLLMVRSPLWTRSAPISGVVIPSWLAVLVAVLVTTTACTKAAKIQPNGKDPERVVTLTPSGTELVAALGAADRLVGVDQFSTEPASVRTLPKTGTFEQPNLEAILALRPDLVVVDKVQHKIVAPLTQAGIRTLLLEMQTVADVRNGLLSLGEALGRSQASRELIAEIDTAIEGARARTLARQGEPPTILAVVDRQVGTLKRVYVAGPGSYIDELLAILGASNAMAGSGLRYSNIGAEQILRARPTIILDALHTADTKQALRDWDVLPQVPAVERGRVIPLTGRIFTSPSPRLGQALRQLEQLIYGISAE